MSRVSKRNRSKSRIKRRSGGAPEPSADVSKASPWVERPFLNAIAKKQELERAVAKRKAAEKKAIQAAADAAAQTKSMSGGPEESEKEGGE
tara:strand:- start:60 stop:332 length:273 start_codon:yes stop_codon:yes gene_type:complete